MIEAVQQELRAWAKGKPQHLHVKASLLWHSLNSYSANPSAQTKRETIERVEDLRVAVLVHAVGEAAQRGSI